MTTNDITYTHLHDLTIDETLLRLRIKLDRIDRVLRQSPMVHLTNEAAEVPHLTAALDHLAQLDSAIQHGQF